MTPEIAVGLSVAFVVYVWQTIHGARVKLARERAVAAEKAKRLADRARTAKAAEVKAAAHAMAKANVKFVEAESDDADVAVVTDPVTGEIWEHPIVSKAKTSSGKSADGYTAADGGYVKFNW